MKRQFVMLTFDLEEFDIPEEYGQKVSTKEQFDITLEGMDRLKKLLAVHRIPVTFFTTGNFALKNPELIKKLSQRHEIASHALFHSPFHEFRQEDILESKQILEEVTGIKVTGFRMPRLKPLNISRLSDWGFQYDSSINPTFLPGRYNLLHKSAEPTVEKGLIILPCSTSPTLRFPLFWLSFKNLPSALYTAIAKRTLRKRRNLMLYFHPWEFAGIDHYKLPGYVKKPNGERLIQKLDYLISALKETGAEFITSQDYCAYLIKTDKAFQSVDKSAAEFD
ncbi:polysaccharide deacetylase family protein [Dyadobacter subterraneus]|uniref:Polysaccharide deacetylase family protein n=1 Tax=Dyadobacter subterraneus TaxID=2773304 RepID=A0ABR9W9U1_9BACT|nr:polysaccharide deacetylase family protein [Dyadobacter subterraneus]MBE9462212.1 polysaccharide deacetylase family protein [Dyadobacter subterraneus]